MIIKLYYYFLCKNIYDICIRADTWYYISSQTLRLIIASIDISLTKEIEVISVRENNETNVSILSAHTVYNEADSDEVCVDGETINSAETRVTLR